MTPGFAHLESYLIYTRERKLQMEDAAHKHPTVPPSATQDPPAETKGHFYEHQETARLCCRQSCGYTPGELNRAVVGTIQLYMGLKAAPLYPGLLWAPSPGEHSCAGQFVASCR